MTLKERIKTLAEQQVHYKPQRKTVNFTGDKRELKPWQAAMKVSSNKYKLRHMYIAYGELRGRTYEEIEISAKTEYSRRMVDKLKDEHRSEFKTIVESEKL